MASLPPEIYRHICNEVTAKQDLCTITRASSFMQSEAERFIYRDVVTRFVFPRASVVLRLLRRICASDCLASYIWSFTFIMGNRDCLLATINILSRSLRRMTRLQRLSLAIQQCPPRTNIFEHCTFKLLFIDVAWLDQRHNRFVETQTTLRTLKICGIGDQLLTAARSDPAKILPNLTFLSTDPKFSAYLVPGRSITHMWLYDQASPDLLKCLAFASTPLVELALKVYWRDASDIEVLDALAGLVPGLAGLHVMLYVEREIFQEAFTSLLHSLSQFKKIRRFGMCVSREGQHSRDSQPEKVYEARLERVLTACPSLLTVAFHYSWGNTLWIWTLGTDGLRQDEVQISLVAFFEHTIPAQILHFR